MNTHKAYEQLNAHQRRAVDAAIQKAIDTLRQDFNIQPCMADGAEVVVEAMAVWVKAAKRVTL